MLYLLSQFQTSCYLQQGGAQTVLDVEHLVKFMNTYPKTIALVFVFYPSLDALLSPCWHRRELFLYCSLDKHNFIEVKHIKNTGPLKKI